MHFVAALLAPIMALSAPVATDAPPVGGTCPLDASVAIAPQQPESSAPGWMAGQSWRHNLEAQQVRIRQQIMIRVSPRRPSTNEMVADWQAAMPREYQQRKIGKCLPAKDIIAVQTVSSRDLVLHMADRRMIRALLPKSCNARDFYLGFYVEPNDDGKLCVDRDLLRARSGATCKIGAIRQLVPAE